VLRYLTAHALVESFELAHAPCRFACGAPARERGCATLTDGAHVFPEGFAHYMRAHGVAPPRAVVAAALRAAGGARAGAAGDDPPDAAVAAWGDPAALLPARNHLLWDPVECAAVPLPAATREWLRGASSLEL